MKKIIQPNMCIFRSTHGRVEGMNGWMEGCVEGLTTPPHSFHLVGFTRHLCFIQHVRKRGRWRTLSFGDSAPTHQTAAVHRKTNYRGPRPPAWLCARTRLGESVIVSGHRWVLMRGPPLRPQDTASVRPRAACGGWKRNFTFRSGLFLMYYLH